MSRGRFRSVPDLDAGEPFEDPALGRILGELGAFAGDIVGICIHYRLLDKRDVTDHGDQC